MDRNPKTPLEEIFEDNYLTRLAIGVAVAACWPPSCKLPVVKHAQPDEVVDGRFGGLRLPPLLPHHFGPFAAFVLAIFDLFHPFALALLVYREHIAPNGGEMC
jgi:hypothetical protein